MKKFKCYDCEKVFEAETSKEMLNKMHPHYMSEHADIIKKGTKEEGDAWMEKFNKDWENTEEVE